jgi:replicative DNA helicase
MKTDLPKGARVPPQNIEAEELVLGAVLIDKDALPLIDPVIDAEAFYKETHRAIFAACKSVSRLGQGVDMVTVANELKRAGKLDFVGGYYYLTELTMKIASSAHIESHAKIVQEKYILRSLIQEFMKAVDQSYSEEAAPDDLLSSASGKVYQLTQAYHRRQDKDFSEIIDQVVANAEAVGRGEIVETIPTPITQLSRTLAGNGWGPGKVYILAARPGMGKTAFAGQCLAEAAARGGALFISLEMTEEDIARRLFTVVNEELSGLVMFSTGVKTDADRRNVGTAAESLKKLNIHLHSSFSTVQQIRTLIKTKVHAHGVKFVVVDYLQLVTPDAKHGNREQEISSISREFKKLSLELKIPILLLSQLSRNCEQRPNKRPVLSDLRDSGAIEQDADAVLFLYRDSVYSGDNSDDSAELIIAKNRNGSLGFVPARFIGSRMVYTSPEPKYIEHIGKQYEPKQQELPLNDEDPF